MRTPKLLGALAVLALVPVLSLGCSSSGSDTVDASPKDTGPADTGGGGDGGDETVDTGPLRTCDACVAAECKDESAACSKDAACVARADCMRACTDVDCQNKCISDNPTDAGDAYIACIKTKCLKECSK